MTVPWRDPVRLRELYYDEGLTASEVAERLRCGETTVLRWMARYCIERRDARLRSGRDNPCWVERASFDTNSEGYERWQSPVDGHAGVLVHRLAAVAWFGWGAVADNHIHHENGVPWDNRESNVEPLSPSAHKRLHTAEQPRDDRGKFATADEGEATEV